MKPHIVLTDASTPIKADALEAYSGVSAPTSVSVDFDRKLLLHLHDGCVLTRRAGF
jgi:hypothetical protein